MKFLRILFVFFCLALVLPVYPWSNHRHSTRLILQNTEGLDLNRSVQVETLEAFLKEESAGLALLLESQEKFLREKYPDYLPRPDELRFQPENLKTDRELRKAFFEALRMNPNVPAGYYVQVNPDETPAPAYSRTKLTIFGDPEWLHKYKVRALRPGMKVKASEVLETASDEPDYGYDIGLYEDNETAHGEKYRFGLQPFGNPKLEYSSQAPFHMGFYHESSVIYTFAPYMKHTMPEMRIVQCMDLARFAFKTGHDYWGFRFLGWGLHYIQDLTQPYHSRMVPGSSALSVIGAYTASAVGADGPINGIIDQVSHRHLSIEHYQYGMARSVMRKKDFEHPLVQAFRKHNETDAPFDENYTRKVLTYEAESYADDLDEAIEKWDELLAKGEGYIEPADLARNEEAKAVDDVLFQIMQNLSKHTRVYIRAGLQQQEPWTRPK